MSCNVFRMLVLIMLVASAIVSQPEAHSQALEDIEEYIDYGLIQMHTFFDFAGEEPVLEMAAVAVYVSESDTLTKELYDDVISSYEDDLEATDLSLSRWEGVGDAAITGSSTEDENIINFALARENNILVFAMVIALDDRNELPLKLVEHVLETGPADSELVFDQDGNASGGWAEAFPQTGDIEGLSHMESGDVFDLFSINDPASDQGTTPDTILRTSLLQQNIRKSCN